MDKAGEYLRWGVASFKNGKKGEAQSLFIRALKEDQENGLAWLWLGTVADSAEHRLVCLQKTLEIDPSNSTAMKLLRKFSPFGDSETEPNDAPHQNVNRHLSLPAAEMGSDVPQFAGSPDQKIETDRLTEFLLVLGVVIMVLAITAVLVMFFQSFS